MTLDELKFMLRIFAASPIDLHRNHLPELKEDELVRLPVRLQGMTLPHQALTNDKCNGCHVLDNKEVVLYNLGLYRDSPEETDAKVMENYLRSGRYAWHSERTERTLYIDFHNSTVVVHETEEEDYRRFELRPEIARSFYFSYGAGSLQKLLNHHGEEISNAMNKHAKHALNGAFEYSEQLRAMEYRSSLLEKLHATHTLIKE